jgi:hypothetical protein
VPAREDSQNAEFEEISSSLIEGLKTCRAVVRSYRTLLVGNYLPTTQAAVNDDGPWSGADLGPNDS